MDRRPGFVQTLITGSPLTQRAVTPFEFVGSLSRELFRAIGLSRLIQDQGQGQGHGNRTCGVRSSKQSWRLNSANTTHDPGKQVHQWG